MLPALGWSPRPISAIYYRREWRTYMLHTLRSTKRRAAGPNCNANDPDETPFIFTKVGRFGL